MGMPYTKEQVAKILQRPSFSLSELVYVGHLQEIQYAIELGADPKERHSASLKMAITLGRVEIAHFLLPFSDARHCLKEAAWSRHIDHDFFMQVLSKARQEPIDPTCFTNALSNAIDFGYPQRAQELLPYCKLNDLVDKHVLPKAMSKGRGDLLNQMLALGFPEEELVRGCVEAARKGDLDVIKAAETGRNIAGGRILDMAAHGEHIHIVEHVWERCTDQEKMHTLANVGAWAQWTMMDWMVERMDTLITNEDTQTALSHCIQGGQAELVRRLSQIVPFNYSLEIRSDLMAASRLEDLEIFVLMMEQSPPHLDLERIIKRAAGNGDWRFLREILEMECIKHNESYSRLPSMVLGACIPQKDGGQLFEACVQQMDVDQVEAVVSPYRQNDYMQSKILAFDQWMAARTEKQALLEAVAQANDARNPQRLGRRM